MEVKYMEAATNYTLANTTKYDCGLPREDSFHMFRDPVTGDIPWPGATIGLTVLTLFVWCQDQLMVQRCLSAKNIANAKGGTLLAAGLKLLSLPLFVIPGMISRILFTDEVACASPEHCIEVCGSPAGCSNIAYPLLVLRILPIGIRGLMLAAVLAGLMSTLTSVFNSASSLVTLDLWTQFRKHATQNELMIVGRVTVLVLVVISVLWLPILQNQQGGIFWFYVAAITAYFTGPWCVAFMMGLLFKRATEPGVFYGLLIGMLIGIIRMCLDFITPPPNCGSGDPDTRMSIITKVDFLHFAIINAILTATIMIVISLFTKPRKENQLRRITWWTRHDETDPDLTDDEYDDDEITHGVDDVTENDDVAENGEGKHIQLHKEEIHMESPTGVFRHGCHVFKNLLCGSVDDNKRVHISKEERQLIRQKMTSIKEGPWTSCLLNATAVLLLLVVTFLCGVFA